VAVPQDWTAVALTNGNCPSGFGFPERFVTGATADPYACDCTCGTTPQVCSGTALLNEYTDSGCADTPASVTEVSFSTECDLQASLIAQFHGYLLSDVAFGPAPECAATPTVTDESNVDEQEITVCSPNMACDAGACLSDSEQAALCVAHIESVACPDGFPNQTLIAQSVSDTRDCGACTCESTLSCTFIDLLVDNDSLCGTDNPYNFIASTSCAEAPNNFPFNASQAGASVTGSGECTLSEPSEPTGGVALDPATITTVCCR